MPAALGRSNSLVLALSPSQNSPKGSPPIEVRQVLSAEQLKICKDKIAEGLRDLDRELKTSEGYVEQQKNEMKRIEAAHAKTLKSINESILAEKAGVQKKDQEIAEENKKYSEGLAILDQDTIKNNDEIERIKTKLGKKINSRCQESLF